MATAALLRDPRAVRLSNQLRGQAAALAQRGITSVPAAYIDEVADKMIAAGWTDLREIEAEKTVLEAVQPFPKPGQAGAEGEVENLLAPYDFWRWTVNGATMFETPYPGYWFGDTLPLLHTDDGQFTAYVQWIDPPGAPVVMLRRKTGRRGLDILRGVKIVGGFLVVAAGLPPIIGEAVLGAELAAAYPAAANAIGTVATRTVLTGGDVESAVRSAATSFAGAEFGDLTAQAVDSAAIGAAAGAAASAALAGGDPRAAAVQAFLRQGAKVSDLFPGDPTEYDPSEYLYLPGDDATSLPGGDSIDLGDLSLDDLGLSIDLDSILGNLENPEALTVPADALIPDDSGVIYTVDGHFAELTADAYIDGIYPDEGGNIRAPDNQILLTSEEIVIKRLETPAELADAIRAKIEPLQGSTTIAPLNVPSLRPLNLPMPAGQSRVPVFSWADQADKLLKTAVSIGGSIKAIANGTFRPPYPTSPYGTARPPVVGVPVRQPDGSTVVNNGNGTSTIRYADGRVQTIPSAYTSTGAAGNYGQTLIPGVPNTALLIGGGLVVAALLLSRR